MRKQKTHYRLRRLSNGFTNYMVAKRDLSFEIKLTAQLMLDELVADYNKAQFDQRIDESIAANNREQFEEISKENHHYTWEY
ncbi:hypothetical protein SAMN05421734_11419 [Pelagirhabdus alkalitolerans]|uniref:IDEAL domain-containing protein n=1 Tax=Pelagirhabdus alkalitolerans TaxID=1612202 RepID=A0A1G6N4E8_9BACI|nr:hypothetical protein [Pelagirhabdus alkalitolerans]SDC62700.1 hypothetical protein SAMN05421734_11419 [Pelagirhabdus alkalitolerans]